MAGSADSLFQKANTAYQNNNFVLAIELYEKITAEGLQSTALEYNLGNAYFRNDNLGKAILHYERALLQSADDEDILFEVDGLEIGNGSEWDDVVMTAFALLQINEQIGSTGEEHTVFARVEKLAGFFECSRSVVVEIGDEHVS